MSLCEIPLACLPSVDTRFRCDADTMPLMSPDGRVAGVILPFVSRMPALKLLAR